jgi:threonyl-tRNA synthetase
VRGFTQDDAHLFCTPEQVGPEVIGCLKLVRTVLTTLGMNDYRVRVSLRDADSSKYVGDPGNWAKAEAALRQAVEWLGVPFTEEPGEAAFYGPKIDFVVKDVIGREWQLGTVQVDYNLPERFGLEYVGADNQAHRPVMIHRAPFGSFERFTGVLIEHFAGHFPTWLAPEQVRVLPISEKSEAFAAAVHHDLEAADLRSTIDLHPDKIGAKIRNAQLDHVPYMLIIGEKEAAGGSVSVRHAKRGDLGVKPAAEFIAEVAAEVRGRRL